MFEKVPKNERLGRVLTTFPAVLTILGCLLVFPFTTVTHQTVLAWGCVGGSGALLVLTIALYRRSDAVSGALLCGAGALLRLLHIVRFPYWRMQHDVGRFTDDRGHAAYIRWFLEHDGLPPFDGRTVWQFYHPPLHHALEGAWLRLLTACGVEGDALWEAAQMLPFAYSTAALVVFALLLREVGARGAAFRVPLAVMAVHPAFLILAGSLNNDMLSILCMMLALLWTLRWDKDPTARNIVPIALAIGLGMLAKLSAWMAAPAAAVVFLRHLVFDKDKRPLIGQFVLFGAICCPLGLFWSVRGLVRWGIPPTWIPMLSDTDKQYVGNIPIYRRLFDLSPSQFTYVYDCFTQYGQAYNEYSPLVALMKTAVFDEFLNTEKFPALAGWGEVLFWVHAALALVVTACAVRTCLTKDGRLMPKLVLAGTYLVTLGSYIGFCLSFAHVCTQSIRYATPVIYTSLLLAAMGTEKRGVLEKIVLVLAAAFTAVSWGVFAVVVR